MTNAVCIFVLQLLTNIFLIPYMALRLQPDEDAPKLSSSLPNWSPAIGLTGFVFGNVSLWWFAFGRPEFGDLALRVQHGMDAFASDRVCNV